MRRQSYISAIPAVSKKRGAATGMSGLVGWQEYRTTAADMVPASIKSIILICRAVRSQQQNDPDTATHSLIAA